MPAMRRIIATPLGRCLQTASIASVGLRNTQFRFQSQGNNGIPRDMRPPADGSATRPASTTAAAHPPSGGAPQPYANGGEAEPSFEPPRKPTEVPKFVKISTNEKGITHLQLARAPVNSLNLEMLQELNQWLLWIGSNDEAKAVVLSSAIPTVFSAGIDLAELYHPKPERLSAFWQSFQELWLILNSFPKPIIGAITGNSPAGGCILAMACDYRIMARGPKGNTAPNRLYRIGLNEAKLGIVAPAWTMPAYAYLLGSRQAERMLQLGETPIAADAQRLGLIDDVVEEEEQAVSMAFEQAERFMAVPQQSRWMARDMMRREYLQMLASDEERNYDTEFVVQLTTSPEVQKNLGTYLDRLKSRTRK